MFVRLKGWDGDVKIVFVTQALTELSMAGRVSQALAAVDSLGANAPVTPPLLPPFFLAPHPVHPRNPS